LQDLGSLDMVSCVWPVIRYRRVADWAPAGWLDGETAEVRRKIAGWVANPPCCCALSTWRNFMYSVRSI